MFHFKKVRQFINILFISLYFLSKFFASIAGALSASLRNSPLRGVAVTRRRAISRIKNPFLIAPFEQRFCAAISQNHPMVLHEITLSVADPSRENSQKLD